jgi:hypothetical protein
VVSYVTNKGKQAIALKTGLPNINHVSSMVALLLAGEPGLSATGIFLHVQSSFFVCQTHIQLVQDSSRVLRTGCI